MVHLARHVWFLVDASVIGSQTIKRSNVGICREFPTLAFTFIVNFTDYEGRRSAKRSGPVLPACQASARAPKGLSI